jgi:hypothetical protein
VGLLRGFLPSLAILAGKRLVAGSAQVLSRLYRGRPERPRRLGSPLDGPGGQSAHKVALGQDRHQQRRHHRQGRHGCPSSANFPSSRTISKEITLADSPVAGDLGLPLDAVVFRHQTQRHRCTSPRRDPRCARTHGLQRPPEPSRGACREGHGVYRADSFNFTITKR